MNTRIRQLCDEQLPRIDRGIQQLGKQCAGNTAGASGDYDVSMDQRVQNFVNRSQALCRFLKESRERIQGGQDNPSSFCGRFANRVSQTGTRFTFAGAQGTTSEDLNRQRALLRTHGEAALAYGLIRKDAENTRAPIDRILPEVRNQASHHTEDQGLRHLAQQTQNARQARETQIQNQANLLQRANPAPANRDQQVRSLRESATACSQLNSRITQYLQVMENNLLPNGRRMSRLLAATETAVEQQIQTHSRAAEDIRSNIQRLSSADSPRPAVQTREQSEPGPRPAPITELSGQPVQLQDPVSRRPVTATQTTTSYYNDPNYVRTSVQSQSVGGRIRQVEWYRRISDGSIHYFVR